MEVIYLTKVEFINELSHRTNLHPDILRCVFDNTSWIIAENIFKEDKVDLPKIGRFCMTKQKSRYGYDVVTGKNKLLDECIYPTCKISSSLKHRVKGLHE